MQASNDGFQPLVIIGAARSGTNMLRDILTQLPAVTTWPCDEINYIWRYRNSAAETDEFTADMAQANIVRYIRSQFHRMARRSGCPWVVEKTCANSLRVGFVDRVVPDARYVFLVRDGRDVVASALKRWTAPLEWKYIAQKARFVPFTDVPYYASRYLVNRLHRLQSPERRLASWGPRFAGMADMLNSHSLAEVCAAQWARSVTRAENAFQTIAPQRFLTVRYEDFVQTPLAHVRRIVRQFEIPHDDAVLSQLVSRVKTQSVSRWKQELDRRTIASVEQIAGQTLQRWEYLSMPSPVSCPMETEQRAA